MERTEHITGHSGMQDVLILNVDVRGTITLLEGSLSSGLGRPSDELIGLSIFEVPKAPPRIVEAVRTALAGRETEVPTSLGNRDVTLRCAARRKENRVIGALLVATPAASPRERQTAQRERQQMRRLFEQLPGAVWSTDAEMRVTHGVGRVPEGVALSTAVGQTVAQFVRSDDPNDIAVVSHRAALAGEPRHYRYTRDKRTYEATVEPLRDASGKIVGTVGIAIDITVWREVELRLLSGEARLAEAQRITHVGSWEWDLRRDELIWSAELYRIYGVARADFARTLDSFLARVHPEDRETTRAAALEAVRERKGFELDHRIVRPDGVVRMLLTRANVVLDEQGRAARLVGSCWDITDRWKAARKLDESLSLLRATLEATADGILVVDREGKIRAFNHRFLSLWRIAAELGSSGDDAALLDSAVKQLEEPTSFMKRVRELYEQPDAQSFDVIRFTDGRIFERFSLPQRVDSEIVGRVWSFRDVTDREQSLRRALFLSDASRLLASLDVETALDSVGHLAIPYIGDACAIDLISDEGGPRRLLAIAQDHGNPSLGEIPPAIFSGHSLVYSVGSRSQMAVPLNAHGTLLGVLTFATSETRKYTVTDLSIAEELARRIELALENSRLYRHAQEALRAREEFLSIAAHEIRGPLTSLALAADMLKRPPTTPAVSQRAVDLITREVHRLANFVDELLDVARIRGSQMRFELEPVDLGDVVRTVASRLKTDLAHSGSSLSVTAGASVVGIWDRARIDQVVTNLLSNAIKFGLGRPIEVFVTVEGAVARIVTIDHGIGIPADRLKHIFQPFERAVSSRHYGGLGLGLYIVRTIVDGLGGNVHVESEQDHGARITVDLPLARAS